MRSSGGDKRSGHAGLFTRTAVKVYFSPGDWWTGPGAPVSQQLLPGDRLVFRGFCRRNPQAFVRLEQAEAVHRTC